ncbi:hypothetical protein LTS14_009767 [Recurvomyces mirabilis]|nr:hypothetical protein LTS14_009767 [Recurvomyces mirabilis]
MANMVPEGFAAYAGMKRHRDRDDDGTGPAFDGLYSKKIRPTINPSEEAGHYDSVLSTPTNITHRPKYDSDDQSSMVSEPGSPQDYAESHSSGDDMDVEMESALFSPAASSSSFSPRPRAPPSSSPWRERVQGGRDRVATPFGLSAARPASRALQVRTGAKTATNHIRSRHPQENTTITTSVATVSDHLEVPSPIDEDEARTPPSAADVTGSQLSMLSDQDWEASI